MAGWNDERLIKSRQHAREVHARWRQVHFSPDYKNHTRSDEVISLQCGGCIFYAALEGTLGSDWGVCTNEKSEYDGKPMFEHDGCGAYRGELTPEEEASLTDPSKS